MRLSKFIQDRHMMSAKLDFRAGDFRGPRKIPDGYSLDLIRERHRPTCLRHVTFRKSRKLFRVINVPIRLAALAFTAPQMFEPQPVPQKFDGFHREVAMRPIAVARQCR